MQIYSDYDEEPEELYLPLPANLYREFYDLEMAGYSQDFSFYETALEPLSDILELGCGSGRLTRFTSASGHRPLGIDLSLPMLLEARSQSGSTSIHVCMDMCRLALRKRFDAIIIPYNTLNLLAKNSDVQTCLNGCRDHLKPDGGLLLQLYVPSEEMHSNPDTTTFHFQMFDRPRGGKIIKEILRRFHTGTRQIEMTERYKIRPMQPGAVNTNYAHTMLLNANDQTAWLNLLHASGFSVVSLSQPNPTTLFVTAKLQC
jgi:SAM-dependent methyltransferase